MNFFPCNAKGDYAREGRKEIFLCSFQFSWKSFKIHDVTSFACSFLCIICNEPVFHHFKRLLKYEIDLSLEMSVFLH